MPCRHGTAVHGGTVTDICRAQFHAPDDDGVARALGRPPPVPVNPSGVLARRIPQSVRSRLSSPALALATIP